MQRKKQNKHSKDSSWNNRESGGYIAAKHQKHANAGKQKGSGMSGKLIVQITNIPNQLFRCVWNRLPLLPPYSSVARDILCVKGASPG